MFKKSKKYSFDSTIPTPSSSPFLPASVSPSLSSASSLESSLEKLLSGQTNSFSVQDYDSKGKLNLETVADQEDEPLGKNHLKGSNEEIDQKFLDDRNLYFGDIILVFPNPDEQGVRRNIKVMKALKVYQKSFDTDYDSGQNAFEDALFKAFFKAFEKLPDFNGKQDSKGNFFQNFVEEIEMQEINKIDSRKSKSIQQKNKFQLNVQKVIHINRLKKKMKNKESDQVPNRSNSLVAKHHSRLKNIKKIIMKKMLSQDKKLLIPDKHLYGGAIPNRKMKDGQSKNITQDFSTLMRNTILTKLNCQAGFKSRSFVNSSGEFIFTVLYSRDFNLKITAEKDSFNKQVSLALSDLLSLEPVDHKRRPIRLNTWLKDDFNPAMTKYFLFLKPKILQLLKDINYKLISRELRIDHFEENHEINENDNVSDELWNAYFDYLNILKENIKKIRKRFKDHPTLSFTTKNTPTTKEKSNYPKPKGLRSNSLYQLPMTSSSRSPFSPLNTFERTETEHPFADSMNTSPIPPTPSALAPDQSNNKTLNNLNRKNTRFSPNDLHTKKFKNELRKDISEEFKELFLKALEVVNYQYKKKILVTIWDCNRMDYKEAFFDYFITPKNKSFKVRQKLDAMWKRFVVTETGFHSLFSRMERLKLADNTLNKFINMPFLLEESIVQDCFVLNDMVYLAGVSAWEIANIKKRLPTEMLKTLKFATTEEENGDIESGMIEKSFLQRKDTVIRNIEKEKVNNLNLEFEFKWTRPTYVPLERLRNYYGEKVALYFLFISKFTNHMTPIAMCSIIYVILGNIITDIRLLLSIDLMIVFLISFWSNSFLRSWKRQELLFAISYGQLDFEHDEKERSLFRGTYKRSLQNDHLNVLSYPQSKRVSKVIIAILFTLVLVSVDVVAVYLLINLSMMLENYESIKAVENLALVVSIPSGLNYVLNEFLNKLYTKFAIKYTSFENHRTLTSFESSYIVKKFLFSTTIMIIPLLMISFVAKFNIYDLECYQNNCYHELRIFTRTNFILNLFFNLWEVIEPRLPTHSFFYRIKKLFWKTSIEEDGNIDGNPKENIMQKPNQLTNKMSYYEGSKQIPTIEEDLKEDENDSPKQNYSPFPFSAIHDQSSFQSHSSLPSKRLGPALAKSSFYESINAFIESEFEKHSYTESQDIYGTVEDYMEICISYSFFALYGIGDPIIFIFGLLIMVLEIHTDKLKLLKYSRRPLPLGEKSIGIWLSLIELVANASILSNAAVYAFSTYDFENNFSVLLFVILILGNFVLNWVFNLIVDEIPANMVRIMGRHKNIVEKTLEGIGNKSNMKNLLKKKIPIFKIFNTELVKDNSIQEFEDIDYFDYNLPDKGISQIKLSILQRKKRAIYLGVYFKEWRTHLTGRKTPHLQAIERTHRKRRRKLGEKDWNEILRKFKKFGIKNFSKKIQNFHLPFHYRASLASIFVQKPRKISENEVHSNPYPIPGKENEAKIVNMEKNLMLEYFNMNNNDVQFPEVLSVNGLSLYFLDDFKRSFSSSTQFFLSSANKPFHFLPLKYSELDSMKLSRQRRKDFLPVTRIYVQPNDFENSPYSREVWLVKQIDDPVSQNKTSRENGDEQYYIMEIVGYEKWDKELEASFTGIKKAYENEEVYFEKNEIDFFHFREHKSHFVWAIFQLGVINFSCETNFFKYNLQEIIRLRKRKEEYYTDSQIMLFLEMFYQQIDRIKLNREMYYLEKCFFLQKNNTYKYVPLYPNKIFTFGGLEVKTISFKTRNEVLYYIGVLLLKMIILDSIEMDYETDFIFQMLLDLKNEYPLSTKIISHILQMKNNENNYNLDINNQSPLDQLNIANELSYLGKIKMFRIKRNFKAILRINFIMGNHEEVSHLFSSKNSNPTQSRMISEQKDDSEYIDFVDKTNIKSNSDIKRKKSILTFYIIALLNYLQQSNNTEHLLLELIEELDKESEKIIICYLIILKHKMQTEQLEKIDELLATIWEKFFSTFDINKKIIAYFYEIQGQIHSDLGRSSLAIISFTRMKEICLANQINDLLERCCFYLTKELFLFEDFDQMQREIRNFPNMQSEYNLILYAFQAIYYLKHWNESQLVDVLDIINEILIKTDFEDFEKDKVLLQFLIEFSDLLKLLPKSTLNSVKNHFIILEDKKKHIKNKGIELCIQILDYYIDKCPLISNFSAPKNVLDYLSLRLSYNYERIPGSIQKDQAVEIINFLKFKIEREGPLRKRLFTFELYATYKLLKDHDKMIESLHWLLNDVTSIQNNSVTEFLINSELAFQQENSECCNYLTKIFKNILRKNPQILKLKLLFYFSINLLSKGFHLKSLDFLEYIEKSLYPLDPANDLFFFDTLLLKLLALFRLDNLEHALSNAESLLELIEKRRTISSPKKGDDLETEPKWFGAKRKGILMILGKIHWRLGRLKNAFYFLDLAWRENGDQIDQLAIRANIAELQREAGKIEGKKGVEKLREEINRINGEQEIDDDWKVFRLIFNIHYEQIKNLSKEGARKLGSSEQDAEKVNRNNFTSFLIEYQIKKLKLIIDNRNLDINNVCKTMGTFIYDDIQFLELIMATLRKNELLEFQAKLELTMQKLKGRVKTKIWLLRLSFCRGIFYRKLQKVNKASKIFDKHKDQIQLLAEMPYLTYYFIKEFGKHHIMQGNMMEAEEYLRKGLSFLELRDDNHFFYWEKAHLYYILGKLYVKYADIIKEYKNYIDEIHENELSPQEKHILLRKLDNFDHDILIQFEKNKKKRNLDPSSFIEILKNHCTTNVSEPPKNELPLKSVKYKGKLSFEKGLWLITTLSTIGEKDSKLLEKIHKKIRLI